MSIIWPDCYAKSIGKENGLHGLQKTSDEFIRSGASRRRRVQRDNQVLKNSSDFGLENADFR